MQIVIDIPEDVYTRLFDNGVPTSIADGIVMERAIRKGTPLPKGHGRIVDENKITSFGWNGTDNHAVVEVPTIIEADKEDRK